MWPGSHRLPTPVLACDCLWVHSSVKLHFCSFNWDQKGLFKILYKQGSSFFLISCSTWWKPTQKHVCFTQREDFNLETCTLKWLITEPLCFLATPAIECRIMEVVGRWQPSNLRMAVRKSYLTHSNYPSSKVCAVKRSTKIQFYFLSYNDKK